eukprot:SAG31_NODE_791_length_12069_cov_22.664411_4_plen_1018_part_00
MAGMPAEVEGPCEPSLVALPDGKTLLSIYRLQSNKNLWMSRSTSGGRSWETAEQTSAWAVFPQARVLPNGALVVTAGRPGVALWLTDARHGSVDPKDWRFYNLAAAHNAAVNDPQLQFGAPELAIKNASSPTSNPVMTKAYTGLELTACTSSSCRMVVSYDRLCNGNAGPPGPYGEVDHSFTMQFDVVYSDNERLVGTNQLKSDDTTASTAKPSSTSMQVTVHPASGQVDIVLGQLKLAVSSTFISNTSLHALGTAIDPPLAVSPWISAPRVDQLNATHYTVTTMAEGFLLHRSLTIESHRLVIGDQLTVKQNASGPLGIEIAHRASFLNGQAMTGALVPGTGDTWACNSITDEEMSPKSHRTRLSSYGNPTIHAHGPFGGAGLVPLDDVFETHSYANNSAFRINKLPVQSDPPASRAKANVCGNHGAAVPCICPISDPPSISVVDPYLALPPGEVYTQEWAVYPMPESCADYFCFINTVRADLGVDNITMPGTGFLAMSTPADAKEGLVPAGFTSHGGDWAQWNLLQLEQFYEREATHFVVADNAFVNRTGNCGSKGDRLCCEGTCFLNELGNDTIVRWQHLIRQSQSLGRNTYCYQNSGINTGIDAEIHNADSAMTDWAGDAMAYRTCTKGKDMWLQFANGTNSWSRVKEKVYDKILELGFHGIYHDCFLFPMYTFSQWDRRSALLDPDSRGVVRLLGSVVLMTQDHEMILMDKIKTHGGGVIANGQPATRTLREYARSGNGSNRTVAGEPGGANLHFREDSPQFTSVWTHLFTPITLNRYGGQRGDLDPKYNTTCPGHGVYMSPECVGKNIGDNLDFGLATFLYDGLFPNKSSSASNILHAMFPLTVRRLASGLIVARERVITKNNGTARWDAQNKEWDFSEDKDQKLGLLNRNPLRWPEIVRPTQSRCQDVQYIVQTFAVGLLVVSETVDMSPAGIKVDIQPGQIAVVSSYPLVNAANKLKTDDNNHILAWVESRRNGCNRNGGTVENHCSKVEAVHLHSLSNSLSADTSLQS